MDLLPEVERLTWEVQFRRGAMNRAIGRINAAKRLLRPSDAAAIDLLNQALIELGREVPPYSRGRPAEHAQSERAIKAARERASAAE